VRITLATPVFLGDGSTNRKVLLGGALGGMNRQKKERVGYEKYILWKKLGVQAREETGYARTGGLCFLDHTSQKLLP